MTMDLTTTIAAPSPYSVPSGVAGAAAAATVAGGMTRSGGDSDTDTPPPRTSTHQAHLRPPTGFLAFANGPLKRHYPTAPRTELAVTTTPTPVSYKECLRNHAASIGGHALDGCCEFMPSPTAVPSDPTSLKCAACGCHRNFHRRDPDDPSPIQHHPAAPPGQHHHHISNSNSNQLIPPPPPPPRQTCSDSPPAPSSSFYSSAPHMLLALSGGGGGQNSNQLQISSGGVGRKRVRTKFSQEQKEKMLELSEKLGWKMQKSDESVVEEFCKEVGVGRGVLKIWMHNNKHTLGKNKPVNVPMDVVSNAAAANCTANAINDTSTNSTAIMNNGSSGDSHNGLYVNGHRMVIREELGNFVDGHDNDVNNHLHLHLHGGGGGGGGGCSSTHRSSSSSSSG